eukprot:361612-Chlamydomonas_euryale.AAC.18
MRRSCTASPARGLYPATCRGRVAARTDVSSSRRRRRHGAEVLRRTCFARLSAAPNGAGDGSSTLRRAFGRRVTVGPSLLASANTATRHFPHAGSHLLLHGTRLPPHNTQPSEMAFSARIKAPVAGRVARVAVSVLLLQRAYPSVPHLHVPQHPPMDLPDGASRAPRAAADA